MSNALALSALALLLVAGSVLAQGLYKYRDAEGNWVYTDRQPDAVREYEQIPLADAVSPPVVRVDRRVAGSSVELVVDNACFCPAEIAVRLLEPVNVSGFEEESLRQVVPARRETVLAILKPTDWQQPMSFGHEYRALLGEPAVKHAPEEPYRAPFALAREFRVTQAYPSQVTHVDAASAYAVDFAMPVGTQIYAARAGTVIEVASQFFEASTDPERARRANVVRVLHADGTMGLYAHLNWDSIRVRPGQIIARGEYIADRRRIGEQHDQPVDADPLARG
ncbi:MAG: M23 family metallopeptidase, partial [Gemmatimonadetes bacterium]|nr:M23 family metallopeptidase [Gemmatimonadota bacterium]